MVPVFLFELGGDLLEQIRLLLAYISSGTAFPQPLDREEEEKELKKLAEGDKAAKDKLIKHNMRLVAHIVKKYNKPNVDNEDLISIGAIGLIKAIESFDPEKKTRLATYAARCIENEILMHLRKTKKLKKERLLHDPIGSDKEGNEISLVDILGTSIDVVSEEVELAIEEEKLYQRLKKLTDREKKVLRLRYGLDGGADRTQKEIAKKLGISRSYVSRIEKKAVHKLHEMFN